VLKILRLRFAFPQNDDDTTQTVILSEARDLLPMLPEQ